MPVPAVNLPETIYHYTDIAGAIAILRHGTIRATHADFMNDRRELKFKSDVLAVVGGLDPRPGEGFDQEDGWYELMWQASAATDHGDVLWISCFSKLEDDLALWGRYGDGGVCIGFDSAALVRALSPTLASEVFYIEGAFSDHPTASAAVENMARAQRLAGQRGEPEFSGLGALAKEHHWASEGEVRLVWHTHAHDMEGVEDGGPFRRMFFAGSKYGARPHIDMPFGGTVPAIARPDLQPFLTDHGTSEGERVTVWESGLVKSVRVGPSPFQDETEKAFRLMRDQIEAVSSFVGAWGHTAPPIQIEKSRIGMR